MIAARRHTDMSPSPTRCFPSGLFSFFPFFFTAVSLEKDQPEGSEGFRSYFFFPYYFFFLFSLPLLPPEFCSEEANPKSKISAFLL